jgi:hypothetical protein
MSRPPRVPERGDVPKSVVARRLGLAVTEFEFRLPELEQRGFPEADLTTGLYCLEAVDRWRLYRHAPLFPELTAPATATHADVVFRERMNRLRGQD